MERESHIDWDKPILDAEKQYRDDLLDIAENLSQDSEDEANEILDEVSLELERVNPDSFQAVDHEEVWKLTGNYPVFGLFVDGEEEQ